MVMAWLDENTVAIMIGVPLVGSIEPIDSCFLITCYPLLMIQ